MPTAALQNLPTAYDHAAAQQKHYAFWEQRGYFHADPASDKPPFSIVIPPPNVTGALHLGHALNNTLQDILCRMKRMQGFNVLWMPGTDHAGIATQAVVERRLLEEEGKSRHDLGREGLVDRIWKWKEQYEERITGQLKQLGCSCDWRRQRFTLDDQCARAVRETFFKLFQGGKIYRGKRLVNWDTFLQTAVSDDEVFHEEVKGHFWHFKYPVIDPKPGEPTHVTIATTRPETMLGDTAVAVHPDPAAQLDKVEAELREKLAAAPGKEKPAIEKQIEALAERRKTKLTELQKLRDMAARGVMLELPLTGRQIPLITDVWAKPELGSGCVKITPAHDANDYEVWQRNEFIGAINILNPDGTLNDNVPEKYRGLKIPAARKAVVEDLTELGLHDPETDREDRLIDLAHSDRSKTPIEPYLADQWFVKMDKLAQSAMDAVTDGRVKITPQRYAKGYLDWLGEKRDWPVGRQLWWGHRIAVWRFGLNCDLGDSESLAKAEKEYRSAIYEYARGHGIQDDIAVQFTGKGSVFVGARTVAAINQLGELCNKLRSTDHGGELTPEDITKSVNKSLIASERQLRQLTYPVSHDQDPHESDVLDTWFSSALWPHSTMGWPDETPELKTFYPTSVLITSRDIITLWVARMVLMGEYNMHDVPFHEVYIHPKILDGYGETMSKSKGNGVDPLDVIEKFGADALRFGIAYLTTETQDVRLPVEFVCPRCDATINQTKKNRVLPRVECDKCGEPFRTQWASKPEDLELPRGAVTSERFELGRRFCNKLWNASRFSLMNLDGYEAGVVADDDLTLEDRWLLSRLSTVTGEVTDALQHYRFADAARSLYDFAWDDFCDYYVEIAKARFDDPAMRITAQRVLAFSLDQLLRILHPMAPFLTEEVWQLLGQVAPKRGIVSPTEAVASVCIADWPIADTARQDRSIEAQFEVFKEALWALREVRSEHNLPSSVELTFSTMCLDGATAALLKPMRPYFLRIARAKAIDWTPDVDSWEHPAEVTVSFGSVTVNTTGLIDVDAERARLMKQRDEFTNYIASIDKKLGNENFRNRAPADIVQQQRDKREDAQRQLDSVEDSLKKLG